MKRGRRTSLLLAAGTVTVFVCAAALASAAHEPRLEPETLGALWFGTHQVYRAGESGGSVAIADVTGDKRNDVLLTALFQRSDNRLFLFRQLPNGSLAGAKSYRYRNVSIHYWGDVDTGDLNADGIADVAVATVDGIDVYRGKSSGLRRVARVRVLRGVREVRIRDVNRDGKLDFVVVAANLNPKETGAFALIKTRKGFSVREVHRYVLNDIEVGDVNGDGRQDVVGMGYGSEEVLNAAGDLTVCLQRARGAFGCRSYDPYSVHRVGPESVEVADVTGDRRADIVITAGGNVPSGRLIVYRQTRAGTLASPAAYYALDIPRAVAGGDLSGDGRMDLVVTHEGHPYLGTFVQKRDGTMDAEQVHPNVHGDYEPRSVAVGDINNDARADVVFVEDGSLYVFRHVTDGVGGASLGVVDVVSPQVLQVGQPYVARMTVTRRFRALHDRSALRVGCFAQIDGRTPVPVATSSVRLNEVVCRWNVPAAARGKIFSGTITARWRNESVTRTHGAAVR